MCPISKSEYISGCQCLKSLWLSRAKPDVCIEAEKPQAAEGEEVGAIARTYFPGATVIPLNRAEVMAEATRLAIERGDRTICEATFLTNDLSCSTDIVRLDGNEVVVYEVKSSTSIEDVQLDDITFQCYAIEQAGYHVRQAFLMHLNSEYIRGDTLDLTGLFRFEDVTSIIRHGHSDVAARMPELTRIVENKTEPCIKIGIHCEKPYECPCKAYCFKQAEVPDQSVFSVPGMAAKKKYLLFHSGYVTPQQLLSSAGVLTERQMSSVKGLVMEGDEIKVDTTMLLDFLSSLRYPLHHLDFETFMKAVPQFKGAKPYMQVPFQYSLHIQEAAYGPTRHMEFLAEEGRDPRRALAERLCHDIPVGAQATAYNASFEKSVLRHLAEQFQDLAEHLLSIESNIVDLMVPFQKKWVISAAMQGSYSIKKVLPALCGDDPALDYHSLPGVQNGGEAMQAYAALSNMKDKNQINTIKQGLLQYCRLDTLALAKVLNRLYELAGLEACLAQAV